MTKLKLKPNLNPVISALSEIKDDITVPKNIRGKIEDAIIALKGDAEISIKLNKTLEEMESIVNEVNIQPYTRTQLWNIISLLEKVE